MAQKIDPKLLMSKVLEAGSHKPSRRMKRYIILALMIVVAAAAVFAVFTGRKSGAVQYKTDQVRSGDLVVIVTATGTLQPTNQVDVGSELSGTIKNVEVDYNSKVKTGQVLARLDTTKLEATIAQSRAALESAKAKVQQAQATVMETQAKLAQYQKVWDLSGGKVPSRTEMDAAAAAYKRAVADAANNAATVSQAQATLNAHLTDLSKSVIKSPINGVVLTRSIEPGQTVAASFTAPVLFTLAEDLAKMDLHVNVDEADIGKVQEGQMATFSVAAYPNRIFEARITQARYGSSTTSGVVTYETVLKVSNPDLSLRPGMTATADITVKKLENVILIPSAALRFSPPAKQDEKASTGLVGALLPRPPRKGTQQRDGSSAGTQGNSVWTLKNGKLTPISVVIGASNGSVTEVTSGDIQPGTEVVTDTITGSQ
ncbi:MAG: efflux RND transporter periplasmic adaptor subunit [Desulfobacterales bacterium]|nr:efflux RND transporter periplasmic adaptor subunit [Desulfobacterales bacterium]